MKLFNTKLAGNWANWLVVYSMALVGVTAVNLIVTSTNRNADGE